MSQLLDYSCDEVTDIQIGKAKKREGFYICPVTCASSKTPFTICFKNASLMELKETSHTVVMKCKSMTRYMDALNDMVIDVVRENSASWFNTRIDDDLIDEYYISTLQYNKKRGETIRLKIKNIEDIEEQMHDGKVNMVVCLKYIKFYKQKFFPEFELQMIESVNDKTGNSNALEFLDDVSDDDALYTSDDEEIPVPSCEEIEAMKSECVAKLYGMKDNLEEDYTSIAEKLTKVADAIHNLEICTDLTTIMRLCEDYQNIACG